MTFPPERRKWEGGVAGDARASERPRAPASVRRAERVELGRRDAELPLCLAQLPALGLPGAFLGRRLAGGRQALPGLREGGLGLVAIERRDRQRGIRQHGAAQRRHLGEAADDEDALDNLAALIDI